METQARRLRTWNIFTKMRLSRHSTRILIRVVAVTAPVAPANTTVSSDYQESGFIRMSQTGLQKDILFKRKKKDVSMVNSGWETLL